MSNTPQPFFTIMPMPWGGQHPSQYQGQPSSDVPARVRTALAFLGQLSERAMDRAAVNDISIEVLPGQKPAGNELIAANAALNMLIDYFGGSLPLNHWEKTQNDLMRQDLCPIGPVIRCPACNNAVSLTPCLLCQGTGKLVVQPLREP